MSRSLRVKLNCIDKVKLALKLNGFPSQRSLAEDVGFAIATVNNFLTGKPVDYTTFEEISRGLALDWREISTLDSEALSQTINKNPETPALGDPDEDTLSLYPGAVPLGSPFYLERALLKEQIEQELRKPGGLVRIKAPSLVMSLILPSHCH